MFSHSANTTFTKVNMPKVTKNVATCINRNWTLPIKSTAWWVKKSKRARKLHFFESHYKISDKQLQIFDRGLWVLKISQFLPIHFPKRGSINPNFAILDKNFPTRRKFFDNFLTAQNWLARGGMSLCIPMFLSFPIFWRHWMKPNDTMMPLCNCTVNVIELVILFRVTVGLRITCAVFHSSVADQNNIKSAVYRTYAQRLDVLL